MASYVLEWQSDYKSKTACSQQGAWNNITSLQHHELLFHYINTLNPCYGFVCPNVRFFKKLVISIYKVNLFIFNNMQLLFSLHIECIYVQMHFYFVCFECKNDTVRKIIASTLRQIHP